MSNADTNVQLTGMFTKVKYGNACSTIILCKHLILISYYDYPLICYRQKHRIDENPIA